MINGAYIAWLRKNNKHVSMIALIAPGIDISPDGVLFATKIFDIDNGASNTLIATIAVFDGNHTVTTDVTVNIQAVNEHSPEFKNPTYTWNVTENKNLKKTFKVLF